jgi:hypothetical protein
MSIDLNWITARLESNTAVLRGQLSSVSAAQAVWKPQADKWSILEVINHLAEEETEDFRIRLQLTLEDPAQEWPAIDPERAAVDRQYNARNLQDSVDRFIRERARSVEWLRSLPAETDWHVGRTHPRAGVLRAGDLLCSWLAHDLIHIRQINRLHYEYLTATCGDFSTAYAGNW